MRKREGIEPRYERLIVGADVLRVRYEISVAMSCLRVIRSGYGR
jgi:hypothetical protein